MAYCSVQTYIQKKRICCDIYRYSKVDFGPYRRALITSKGFELLEATGSSRDWNPQPIHTDLKVFDTANAILGFSSFLDSV